VKAPNGFIGKDPFFAISLPDFDTGDAPVLPASGLLFLGKIHAG